jgi:polyhydroxyalkanoate synthesis repressor PhaR
MREFSESGGIAALILDSMVVYAAFAHNSLATRERRLYNRDSDAELPVERGWQIMSNDVEAEQGTPQAEPVLITRYPNRRLYDREQSRYVTLEDIAELVRQGKTVSVRDSKTGEDLTRAILTQIVLERHPERMELLPVAVLNAMIQANEATLTFLRNYFRQALAPLELLRRSAVFNPFALPMTWMKGMLPDMAPPERAGEVDAGALARRVEELERRLEELQGGGANAAGTGRGKRGRREGREK